MVASFLITITIYLGYSLTNLKMDSTGFELKQCHSLTNWLATRWRGHRKTGGFGSEH